MPRALFDYVLVVTLEPGTCVPSSRMHKFATGAEKGAPPVPTIDYMFPPPNIEKKVPMDVEI